MGDRDDLHYRYPLDLDDPPPPLPYSRGLVLSIRRHVPPPPFGSPCYEAPHGRDKKLELKSPARKRVEYLLETPPPPGPRPHTDTSTCSLKVVDGIAVSDGRGPQLVLCQLDDSPEPLVAKIFDPMYYAIRLAACCADVDADADYSREAAAYEKLQQAGVNGQYLPKYLGSWTFELSLRERTRQVRMILIGHIPGKSLSYLITSNKYMQYDLELRLEVVAQAAEKQAMLEYYGVLNIDFEPRNIMLGDNMHVTLVDLGLSAVHGRGRVKKPPYPQDKGPPSPLDVHINAMDPWVPEKARTPGDIVSPLVEWQRRRFLGLDKFGPPRYLKGELEWEEMLRQRRKKEREIRSC